MTTTIRTLATVLLASCGLLPRGGAAQKLADYDYENLTLRGIGFDYSRIWPSKVDPAAAYSARFDLGYLGPGIRVVPSVTYWSSALRQSELARFADQLNRLPALRQRNTQIAADELGEVAWSDLSFSVDAQAVWTTPALQVFTYVGGGVGLHVLNGQGPAVQETFIEDLLDSTTAGIAIMAGVEVQPLPSARAFAEARFTLLNDVRYAGIRVGGMLMFARQDATAAAARGSQ